MSNSGATVTKFGIIEGVSAEIADFVAVAIQNATKEFIAQGGPSVVSGVPLYSNTQGKLVASSPYSMPNTVGVAGEVLTVDASGDIVYGAGGSPNPFNQDLNTFNDVSFNSVTTANITGPTKVSVAGVDRLDITATETNLFSQNVGTGPTGSQLRLRNDNTFVLGTRFSGNGVIECNPNSMAIYGSEVKSAEILTNSSITKQLTNGTFRIDREIMTGTGQEFRDGNGINRLNITNSDGVTINNAFSLPTTTGSVGDVLTRTGTSATIWAAPAATPTYSPTLTVTNLSQGPSALVQNYTLPTTAGSVGDVLTRTGTSATIWAAPAAPPTYLPTLTVTSLSQGPSALVQNYTLPNRPPAPNQLILSAGSYVMDIPSTLPLQFRVNTISFGILGFGISFPINPTTPISEVLLTINEGIRSFFNGPLVNVVADIIMEYSNFGNRFGFRLLADTPTANFISFSLADNSPSNINNLFGNSLPPDPTPILVLPAPSFIIFPEPAIGVFITPECVWTDLRGIPVSAIQSDSGAATIQCEDVGIGVSGIISYGDYNLNNGSLNNIGNINALDNCNITTNTTQISNGLGEIKLIADSVDRVIIDDTTTTLNSKNGTTGPTGSYLNLNNDSSFSIGSYFANNGAIDCTTNSLALVGPQATSAVVLTDLNIITSLGVGGRIDREILDTTSQSFRDPTGTERLKIDSTDVTINGAYTLPTTAGLDGEVLTRTTGSATTWNRPQIYSIYSQIVDQTVVNTAIEATIIGGGTPTSTLTIPPNFFTPGMTFRYSTGGLFRTSANNITARFRLRNSGVLFDSGLLVFSNRVILDTPWNVEATFAYMGGTVMVTNFNFQYNAGNDARGFTSQQSNNTFNATVSNTLNFTIQWGVQSVNNSITTNFGVVQKIY